METTNAKKLKDLDLGITEQEYRDMDYVSYSFLSTLSKKGAEAKEDDFEGNKGTQTGTLVEELVFGTYNADNYYISDEANIGGVLQEVLDIIFRQDEQAFDMAPVDFIKIKLDQYPDLPYYPKWSNEKRAEKIAADGYHYIDYLKNARGKIVFSNDEFALAAACANTLQTHPFTKDILNPKGKNWDTFHQFKGQASLPTLDIDYKYMVDWLVIDHDKKEVTPWDTKTGNKQPENFQKSYHYWRYDIQDFLYTHGVKEVLKDWYPDYKFNSLRFIYINTVGILRPLIYQGLGVNTRVWEGYRYGGYYHKGIKELVEEYKWYKEHDWGIDHPKAVYDNNGIFTIDTSLMEIGMT